MLCIICTHVNLGGYFMEYSQNKPFINLKQDFLLFKKEHSLKKLEYLNKKWTYYSCGKGKDTIIILPGGLETGEASFFYINNLERRHKIISPIYPAVNTITELVEGINKIIEAEGAENITLFGVSFGGVLAQCFMKKYSNKVQKLILAHTSTITIDYPKEDLKNMITLLEKNMKLIKPAPVFVLRSMLNKKYRKLSQRKAGEEELWNEYFDEVVKEYKKEDIISSMQIILDFITNNKFEYGFLNKWKGKILILEADDDIAFSKKQKEFLKLLYKGAKVHTDHGLGHMSTFAKRDLYVKLIEEFAIIG